MLSLYQAFSIVKSEKEFENFLADLLTPVETKALKERWQIAQILYTTNLSQKAIAKKLDVSVTTVTRVARFLYTEKFGGYSEILAKSFPARAADLKKNQKGRLTASSRIHHA
jgi:Trp operon repressor